MTISRLPVVAWSLATVAAGALLVGCSGSVSIGKVEPKKSAGASEGSGGGSAPKVSAAHLGDTVAEKLTATTGQPKPDVTCPDDLVGKVGTTTRCTLQAGDGSTLGVTVTVTAVDGDKIDYDIKADDTPTPAPN
ncbi:DUF4333 domain-containing protein [Streptomyces sp. NBC_01708]|uniref:DUF4333 domain-containing protein n=1 Tax=Streptomyces sp. NBC_01708 TaxID=2975915 RepID=UPI002E3769ED|nr:DUF4333 domain-containing protein [Streptomyces sp. NBC_01708]